MRLNGTRKRLLIAAALVLAGGVVLLALVRYYVGFVLLPAPGYDPRLGGPTAGELDYFDGERFYNPVPITQRSFGRFLLWRLTGERGEWREWVDAEPGPPPPARVDRGDLRVTFVNHSTMLIQMDGLNILTDPIWSERASPFSWAGPKRHRPPGIRFEDLPPIDVVVISHNHYDHLDIATLKHLATEHSPRFFAGLGNRLLLAEHGIASTDLAWHQEVSLSPDVKMTFLPCQHWSGRGLADRAATLWGAYVFEGPGGPVYFAGDTGDGPHFDDAGERYGPFRLAILPIGAYLPDWFMQPVHISPLEAVDAHRRLRAQLSVPCHYGTFVLAGDAELQPVEELLEARAAAGLSAEDFRVLDFGEGFDVPALAAVVADGEADEELTAAE